MGELKEAIETVCECQYPASIDDILEECEDNEVTLQDGTVVTLGEMLDIVDDPPESFQSSNELRDYILSLAPEESIGRKYYDDRGATVMNDDRERYSI